MSVYIALGALILAYLGVALIAGKRQRDRLTEAVHCGAQHPIGGTCLKPPGHVGDHRNDAVQWTIGGEF
jgi:hypothetical protein